MKTMRIDECQTGIVVVTAGVGRVLVSGALWFSNKV
jgi:hypothetical protein